VKKLMGIIEREWKESIFLSSFAQKEANLLAFQAYDLL